MYVSDKVVLKRLCSIVLSISHVYGFQVLFADLGTSKVRHLVRTWKNDSITFLTYSSADGESNIHRVICIFSFLCTIALFIKDVDPDYVISMRGKNYCLNNKGKNGVIG